MQFCKLGRRLAAFPDFKGLLARPPTPLLQAQEGFSWARRAPGTRPHPAPRASTARLPSRPPSSAEEPGQPLCSPGRSLLSRSPALAPARPSARGGQDRGPRSAIAPSPAAEQRSQPARAPSLPPSPREAEPLRSLPPHPPAAPFQMGRPWPAAEDGSPGPRPQSAACCAPGGRPAGLEAARSRTRAGTAGRAGRAASHAARLASPPDGGCPAAAVAAAGAAAPFHRGRRCHRHSAALAGPARPDARRPGAARSLRARPGRVGRGAAGGGHQPAGQDEAQRQEGPGHAGLRVGHYHGSSPHWHRSGRCAGLPVQEGQRPERAAGAESQRARNAAHHFAPLSFQQPGLRVRGGERHCGAHQPHSGGGDSGGEHSTHGPGRHSGGLRKRCPPPPLDL